MPRVFSFADFSLGRPAILGPAPKNWSLASSLLNLGRPLTLSHSLRHVSMLRWRLEVWDSLLSDLRVHEGVELVLHLLHELLTQLLQLALLSGATAAAPTAPGKAIRN